MDEGVTGLGILGFRGAEMMSLVGRFFLGNGGGILWASGGNRKAWDRCSSCSDTAKRRAGGRVELSRCDVWSSEHKLPDCGTEVGGISSGEYESWI